MRFPINHPSRVLTDLLRILEFVDHNIDEDRTAGVTAFIEREMVYRDTVQEKIKKLRKQGIKPLTDKAN